MNGGWKSGEMDLSFTGLSEHGLVCTRKMLDQLQVGLGISHFHVKIFAHAAHCKEEIEQATVLYLDIIQSSSAKFQSCTLVRQARQAQLAHMV